MASPAVESASMSESSSRAYAAAAGPPAIRSDVAVASCWVSVEFMVRVPRFVLRI
jgi:hypothetical protein